MSNWNFGDLIKFPHSVYSHWAVYTGKNANGEHTVVEFTGESGLNSKAGAKVKEGLLPDGGIVDNQEHLKLKPQSKAQMKATIDVILREGAGKYGLLDNNCEHLATRIRYGTPISKQAETFIDSTNQFHGNLTSEMSDTFGAPFQPPPAFSKPK